MRIPFDSLTLSAVVYDLQQLIGAKVQRISQPEDHVVVLGIYADGGEAYLLLSCDPIFFRGHLVTKRPVNQPQPPQFCSALRSRIDGARLSRVEQVGFDRILVLTFEGFEGEYRLIAELMSKHANLVLVDDKDKIIGVAKPIGVTKSIRPLLAGRTYTPPPFEKRPSLLKAKSGDNLKEFEGASPFLAKLIDALPNGLDVVQQTARAAKFSPVISPGNGAYPMSVAPLGLEEFSRPSISIALEQHFSQAVPDYKAEQLKSSLVAQLNRVLLSREAAISDLSQAKDAAARAGGLQVQAELVLAYGPGLEQASDKLEAYDYDGNPITIRLDPELTYLENANKLFEKAKKAKSGKSLVEDQLNRLQTERVDIDLLLSRVEKTDRLTELETLRDEARTRKWLFQTYIPAAKKEDRPYEGHRIRELIGPGGATVLFGENSTSNDYLTLRVAKPEDYWLHVRGSASAHVVIRTNKHPEKVGPELLLYAAKIAVMNSPSKHSGFVPVDYTLKKHVRKPRGAPAGTALYTHEKTLHVENK